MKRFKNMAEILEEKSQGIAKLEKYKAEGFWANISHIPEREYVRLIVNDELMMSNTPMEQRTSLPFMQNATGNILICGLGLGLVILPLLENDEVKSITVIEKYQDVIDCVLPQIKKYDRNNKLNVVCVDCFEYETKDKYDTIFIDIWPNINSDIYKEEMKPLKQKYRKYLSPFGKEHKNIFVWAETEAKHDMKLY